MVKRVFLIAFFIVLIDQLSKFIIKNYFNFTKNYGAAFGLLQGYRWLFILIALVVIALCVYYAKKNLISIAFILGGTIGNLIDRISYSYIIDFIDLKIWPSFNVADFFSTLGVILLIIYFMKKK